MKSLLISIIFVLSFVFTVSANDIDKSEIDLSPDTHSFVLDTIVVSNQTKKIIFSVYCNGVKQDRKVTVIIDYSNPLFLQAAEVGYKRSGFKTRKSNVRILASVGGLPLKNLYNYTFIDEALEAANIE